MTPEEIQEARRAFGVALRALRELQKLSQSDLGFDRRHIIAIEQGEVDPHLSTLITLSKALQIPYPALSAEIWRNFTNGYSGIGSDALMLPGSILLIAWVGRLNPSNNPQFIHEVFSLAQQRGARKVLLNLAAVECHFSLEEHYDGAIKCMRWFEEHDYWPKVAVVRNATLEDFGAKVANDQEIAQRHGYEARLFSRRDEALAWLQSLPPD